MPNKLLDVISRVIFWRYVRGSWQYDILCGLILAFIFLTPKSVFEGRAFLEPKEKQEIDEQRVVKTPGLEGMANPG
jgi:hypothetical protein